MPNEPKTHSKGEHVPADASASRHGGEGRAPAHGSARAVELLEAQRDRHAENVKRLAGQLKGVARALEVEEGKLSAIQEALTALAPNDP